MRAFAGTIALINPDGDLEVVAPDASALRRLTSGDRFFQFPAWSPDASRIAAIGGNRERAGVFIFDQDQFEPREPGAEHTLYDSGQNAPIYLYWAPNGQHLSFIAMRADEQSMGLHVSSTNKASIKEGVRPHLVTTGRPCFWEWTADAKNILVHVGGADERSARLALMNPFENSATQRQPIPRPGLFQAPGIAVSGRYRAFGQLSRKNKLELIVDAVGGEQRVAVNHVGVAALSWSPARDQLAFISPPGQVRTYYGPLRMVDAQSGEVQTLADDVVLAFFWSPDGSKIVYFTVAQVADTVDDLLPNPDTVAIDGGALGPRQAFQQDDAEEQNELWLNLWVVDVASGENTLLTTFEPVDVFVNQFLPFFDQYAKSHRIWSPDSAAVVLPMTRADGNGGRSDQICVVPIDPLQGRLARVADGLMASWSPR